MRSGPSCWCLTGRSSTLAPNCQKTCLESEHWPCNAYISLLRLHISGSERLRFGFTLAVYTLQTQGRMMVGGRRNWRGNVGGDGDGRNYFQLRRLNSKSCRPWGPLAPRDGLMATKFRGPCRRCVHLVGGWGQAGIKETYVTCLKSCCHRTTFVSGSSQTENSTKLQDWRCELCVSLPWSDICAKLWEGNWSSRGAWCVDGAAVVSGGGGHHRGAPWLRAVTSASVMRSLISQGAGRVRLTSSQQTSDSQREDQWP